MLPETLQQRASRLAKAWGCDYHHILEVLQEGYSVAELAEFYRPASPWEIQQTEVGLM